MSDITKIQLKYLLIFLPFTLIVSSIIPSYLSKISILENKFSLEEVAAFIGIFLLIFNYSLVFFVTKTKNYLLFTTFIFGIILLASGQSIHIATNYIHNTFTTIGDARSTVEFYDETLSHYIAHFGFILMIGSLLFSACKTFNHTLLSLITGILVGLINFLAAVESSTAVLYLVFYTSFIALFALNKKRVLNNDLATHLIFQIFTTISLLVLWWLINSFNFVEFSELGWV